jgi:hypothetical protein
VPRSFFEGRLEIPWDISAVPQDIGCIQDGPLQIDVAATWAEHERFHENWERKVRAEAADIRSRSPELVLSSISHLAIEAARQAGTRAAGLCSLSWDQVLEPFLSPIKETRIRQDHVIRRIRGAYAQADLMVRPTPGLPMPAFKDIADVGPIAQPATPNPSALRRELEADPADLIVLVAFGGIGLPSLPLIELQRMDPFWFILGTVKEGCGPRVKPASALPFSFNVLLASSDIIITKPGYSTVIEAVEQGRPVVYVRRYCFADEADLVRHLHTYGRAVELSAADFASGCWRQALETVVGLPQPAQSPPPPTGALQAAEILAKYF